MRLGQFGYMLRILLLRVPKQRQPSMVHPRRRLQYRPGADIDTTTGLTLHPENGHGGPNFAFYSNLSLGGFCPNVDPAHTTEPMAYRFLFQQAGVAAPTPIASSYVYGLNGVSGVNVGYRYTLWHGDPNTLQPVWITGTGVTSPTPPVSTASPTPPNHYIVPDANGWVDVDQNALEMHSTAS